MLLSTSEQGPWNLEVWARTSSKAKFADVHQLAPTFRRRFQGRDSSLPLSPRTQQISASTRGLPDPVLTCAVNQDKQDIFVPSKQDKQDIFVLWSWQFHPSLCAAPNHQEADTKFLPKTRRFVTQQQLLAVEPWYESSQKYYLKSKHQ